MKIDIHTNLSDQRCTYTNCFDIDSLFYLKICMSSTCIVSIKIDKTTLQKGGYHCNCCSFLCSIRSHLSQRETPLPHIAPLNTQLGQ